MTFTDGYYRDSCLQKMQLPEYQRMIPIMSYRQLHTELSTLESLTTQVMKKQKADEANNRELHAALKKEGEELEDQRRKKRQFDRLKETLEAPTQHGRIAASLATIEALESSFPDLETLASLKKKGRRAVNTDVKQMSTCKILDEITACHGAKAIASRARELAFESLAAKAAKLEGDVL
jgi:hypothetical protein